MARKRNIEEVPAWVAQMGRLTDGSTANPSTGEIYPVGMEIADPEPVAIPSGMKKPSSLKDQMDELFRIGRLRQEADQDETIDDANDFDIDDYFSQDDNLTPWQVEYDPLLGREISPAEFHEKYKSGELITELKTRFAKLDREDEIEEIITNLDRTYKDALRPPKPTPPKPTPGEPQPPPPTPPKT